MNKLTILLLLISLLFGCASFDNITKENRERLNRLSIGMEKNEVLSIMGTETVNIPFNSPSVITNPYKNETMLGASGKTYEILFYYTEVKSRDGVISDDELTPLVFEGGKLIGWGNTFFSDIKRIELKLR